MLDLVEGAKVVQALAPTTQGTANGDYVSMKNAHAVWTVINVSAATTNGVAIGMANDTGIVVPAGSLELAAVVARSL